MCGWEECGDAVGCVHGSVVERVMVCVVGSERVGGVPLLRSACGPFIFVFFFTAIYFFNCQICFVFLVRGGSCGEAELYEKDIPCITRVPMSRPNVGTPRTTNTYIKYLKMKITKK